MESADGKLRYTVILIIIALCRQKCYGYDFRCPHHAEWNMKASAKCRNVLEYFCVLDGNANIYSEFCKENPDTTRDITWKKGLKCVLRGSLDGEVCSTKRYQPFIFRTDGNSDCVFKTSLCQGEGMVVFKNGSATVDTQCRCDYTKGFAFVSKTKHSCYCIPSQEDCSCYKKKCKSDFRLSSEYNCKSIYSLDGQSACSKLYKRNGDSQIPNLKQTYTDMSTDISTNVLRNVARGLVIIGVVTAIGCIVVILLNTFGQPECFMEHKLYRSSQNEEVILQCRIISYHPIKLVTWRNKSTNKILANDNTYTIMEKPPFALVIRQAKTYHSGFYECTLKSCFFGSFVCFTQLKIESSSILTILPSYFPGTEDTILLACSLPSVPFDVKSTIWKRKINNEVINILSTTKWTDKYSVISEPPSLKILNSNADDTGKYICLLSNGVEQMITSIVIDSPAGTSDTKDIYTSPGDKKTLKYYIKSTLPVNKKIQKQKDDVNTVDVVPTEERDKSVSYTIDKPVVEDTGTYVCIVSNSLGTKRLSTRLYVGERPEIITRQTSFKKFKGNDVILHSEVNCALTKLVWENSIGDTISAIATDNTSKYGGGTIECPTLTIKNVNVSDEGCYTCYATNYMGTTPSETISLTVDERPEMITRKTSFNISKGEDVMLCSEVQCVLTKLVWKKSNAENNFLAINTGNSSKYEGGTIECPTLTIKNVNDSDQGCYMCYATNDMGTTSSETISLTVYGSTNQLDMSKMSEMSQTYLTLPEENRIGEDECNADTNDGLLSSAHAQVVLLGSNASKAREKARKFIDEETRIVLVGKTGVGKSSTANTLLGRDFFKACDDPTPVTEKCMTAKGTVGHKTFLLIDTPGIFAINEKQKETELEIKRCIHLAAPGPHVILFVIEYGRIRTDDFESINTFLKYFGEKLKQFVIIVFTYADKIKEYQTLEEWLKKVPQLKQFLNECGNHYCLMSNKNNEAMALQKETYKKCLMNAIDAVKLKNGLLHYTDDAIMEAERKVQEKERIIEQKITQEFVERVTNVKHFNQGSTENVAVISTAQHNLEIEDLHSQYRQRLEKVREEVREEFLNSFTFDDFKELFVKKRTE